MYYKDNNNNYYSFKTRLWRTEEERKTTTQNENGEQVETIEDYNDDEKAKREFFTEITEQEWQDHIQSIAPKEPTQDEIKKASYKKEMAEIQKWLASKDYIINKHLLGEYTDDDVRWTTYLTERATKLARYNELESIIG